MKRLVKLGLIVGAIVVIGKLVANQMAQWQGLTEPELRDKLDSRLPKRMPDDKRAEITEKIVEGMREQGALRDEEPEAAETAESDVSDDVTASV